MEVWQKFLVLIFIGIWFVRIFRRTDVSSAVSADMDSGRDCLPVLVFFHGIHKQRAVVSIVMPILGEMVI